MNEVNMTGATELLLSRVRFEDRSDIRSAGRIARGGLRASRATARLDL